MPNLDPAALPLLRRRLLAWFDRNRRDLPWRHSRDPYHIWVSEVMLQQTQVATVIPYFVRFVKRVPTVRHLAAAGEQEVLRYWEGLGYYRRAVNLHRAARILVAEHGGSLPDDPEVLRRLPGVGDYILGAVLSQAFDRRLPIVETNSLRVFCRLFGQTADPHAGAGRKWLWTTAAALVPARRAGAFNQSLMELGALVCKPDKPRCNECPLARHCVAHRLQKTAELPRSRIRPAASEVRSVAVVVWKRGRVLLARRPDRGRWAGMWEFPHGEVGKDEADAAAASRVLGDATSIQAQIGDERLIVRHGVMHYRITLVGIQARFRKGTFRSSFYQEGRWLKPDELRCLPVSSPQRKLAESLGSEPRKCRLS